MSVKDTATASSEALVLVTEDRAKIQDPQLLVLLVPMV